MIKLLAILFLSFFLQSHSAAQLSTQSISEPMAVIKKGGGPDTNKVLAILQLAHHYYFEGNDSKPTLDKVFDFLQQAQKMNAQIHSTKWQNEISCYYGKYYCKIGGIKKGNEYFQQISEDIKKTGELTTQLERWGQLARNIKVLDTIGLTRIDCIEKMRGLYLQLNNADKVLEMDRAIADTHLKQGKLDLAESELFVVVAKYKSIGLKDLHYAYNLFASTSNLKGDYTSALHYTLLAIENMRQTRDTIGLVNFYCHLGNIYDELGESEKSIEQFKIVFNREFPNPIDFYRVRNAGIFARVLAKAKREREGLNFILGFVKKYPPVDALGKASLARTLAFFYSLMGNYFLAEKYSQQMIALAPSLGRNNEITQEVEYEIGKYYLTKKQFAKATTHFKISLREASYVNSAMNIKDIYLMLFKIDSSTGKYVSAIQYLNRYQLLKDSIFNEVKSRQIEEVQVKFETEKKDKDILLKDKSIEALTKQSQLQLVNLKQEKNSRNMILASLFMLVVLLSVLYNRYIFKQRSNKKLEQQQKEINDKNISLTLLLNEKDWLVKEIHHRVKNNFHMVIALLGTQSEYLTNEEARLAIEESQHRVHAMSLIHQKLYQSENISTINMPDYINELVAYLKDSFDIRKQVQFNIKVEPIVLDLSQAIPLGLILNEAITNSLKYAFPNSIEGIVDISLQHTQQDVLLLSIIDNGVGIAEGFDSDNHNSMGMNLMRGLSKDLGGDFSIERKGGTHITITFTDESDKSTNFNQTT